MDTLVEFLHHNSDLGKTMFYPGSYEDFGMIETFVEESSIDCFVFMDYIDQRFDFPRVSRCMPNMRIRSWRELQPQDFGVQTWDDFWYDHPQSRDFGQPENAYAYVYDCISPRSRKEFKLYYLGTDAIGTYEVLFNHGIIPDVILIQDHGFGGQWQQYKYDVNSEPGSYGDSFLFQFALNHNCLPKYLFSQHWDDEHETPDPWPGYVQVTEPIALGGDMHTFKRSLYKRVDQ